MTGSVLQAKLLPTLDFLLNEWLDLPDLLERERYSDHDRTAVRDLLQAAAEIASTHFEPANRTVDQHEPTLDEGRVTLPPETARALAAYVDFGFSLATADQEHGGLQLPHAASFATRVVFSAASVSILPVMLTEANAALLLAHGTDRQRRVFAERELDGRWSGTMCLSESHAGSSLSDITTRAEPDGPDHEDDLLGPRYRIRGDKMWISAGDHELTENIVHLVLAKIPGPDGTVDPSTRGISLFIVPKNTVDADGALTGRNDVTLVGLNHKLGWRGTPNAALSFGDGTHRPGGRPGAVGYLVGRPGDGLRQMFHMMNRARVEIGLSAASLGFAGYAASLDYARHRPQGRTLTAHGKDATRPQQPIVEHADVRRMLLAQKAYAEGGIALGLFAARLLDELDSGDPASSAEAALLLEILTPVVKSWPSEWCLEANSLAIQVLGGAGYTRDHPVEQYWRDNRLNMIHEGTHGIQALDLLGRKVRLDDGAQLAALDRRVRTTARAAHEQDDLRECAADLLACWELVLGAAARAWSEGDPELATANATPFLQGIGHVLLAWVWLDVALAARASDHAEAPGKVAAARYFFAFELPKAEAWLQPVERGERLCLDLDTRLL